MKYIKVLIISTLLSPFLVLAYSENIIPGGENIGIEAHTEGIIVVGFYKVNGKYIGSDTLNVGDTILKIEGVEVSSIKEMSDLIDKWCSLEETAEYLGVTKDTIRNWIKKTDIPAHKIGRLWKFKFSEVDEWVKSGKSAL